MENSILLGQPFHKLDAEALGNEWRLRCPEWLLIDCEVFIDAYFVQADEIVEGLRREKWYEFSEAMPRAAAPRRARLGHYNETPAEGGSPPQG